MAKGGVTLDTVMINIESDAGKATSNIDNLAKSLETLKSSIKGGFNNINKLADALKKLNKSTAGLKDTAKNMNSVSKISEALKSLDNISNPKGLNSAVKSLEKLPEVMKKFDSKTLENITRVSNELATALTPLANKLGEIGQGLSAISQLANKYGVSVTKVRDDTKNTSNATSKFKQVLSTLSAPFKKVSSAAQGFTKAAISGFKSLNSKVKQVGLSLLGTRTIFTATRKAVSEYMNMDQELSDATTNLWRAMGAQLAPAVEFVMNLFEQFARVIYSVVKAITGIDFIARANAKATAGWGKSAKDALGSLQKFDDLNVVDFGKDSGDNQLIDLETIDLSPIQKIIDLTKELIAKFKEALDTGRWEAVGEALGDVINGVFDFINVEAISNKLKEIATNFGSFLNGAITEIDWSKIGGTVGGLYAALLGTINSVFDAIDWKNVGSAIGDFINGDALKNVVVEIANLAGNLPLILSELINGIDWAVLMQNVSSALISGIDAFVNKINQIDFKQVGENIKTAILNIDWVGLFNSIVDMVLSIVSGAGGLLDGLFGTTVFSDLADTISGLVENVKTIGSSIVEALGEGSEANNIFSSIENIFKNIMSVAGTIGDVLAEWVVSDEFQDVISLVKEIISWIADLIERITTTFSEWFNGEGGQQLKEILKTLTEIVKGALQRIFDILKPIGEALLWLWETIILPFLTPLLKALNWVIGFLGDIVFFIWDALVIAIEYIGKKVVDAVDDVKTTLNLLWSFVKKIINGILAGVEGFINGIIGGLNWLIKQINKISFDVPDWVPGIGGKKLGFDIKEINTVSLPRLETGTNNVPYDDMLAVLHEGEAVVPKKYNPALGGGNSEEMLDRFDRLIFLMENQEQTTNVYVGNKKLYQEQKKYNDKQYNKYGTLEV